MFENMFIFTENDTESCRNTQNINIAQNTPKTRTYIFKLKKMSRIILFKKREINSKKSAFYADLYGIIYIL